MARVAWCRFCGVPFAAKNSRHRVCRDCVVYRCREQSRRSYRRVRARQRVIGQRVVA